MGGERDRPLNRYLAATRQVVHALHRLLSLAYIALCDAIAAACLAIMFVTLGVVVLVGAGFVCTAWHNSGVHVDAAGVAVLCIVAGLAVLGVRRVLAGREQRHYDMQRPWLTTVEQAQADARLRRQLAAYAEQQRRTRAATTGEHAAVESRLP